MSRENSLQKLRLLGLAHRSLQELIMKKATTEISKCINSLTNLKGGKKFKDKNHREDSYKIKDIDNEVETKPSSSNHLSPIKQLKSRFFSNNSIKNSHQTDQTTNNICTSISTNEQTSKESIVDLEGDHSDVLDIQTSSIDINCITSEKTHEKSSDNENISTISVKDGGSPVNGTNSTITISGIKLQSNVKTSVVYVKPPVSSIVVVCPTKSPSNQDNNGNNDETNTKVQPTETECNVHLRTISKPTSKTNRKRPQQHILYDDSLDKNIDKPIATAIVCDIISENRKLYAARKFSLQDVSLHSNDSSKVEEDEQIGWDKSISSRYTDKFLLEGKNSNGIKVKTICESLRRSSEGNNRLDPTSPSLYNKPNLISTSKPTTIVKPLPPKTPPKSSKARYLNYQLNLNSATKIQDLFKDELFIKKFFDYFDPIDYCTLAQVCKVWRKTLYGNQKYWTGLINVIDCNQLRRECLLERNTHSTKREYESAKFLQSIDENNNNPNLYTFKNTAPSHSPNDWPSPPSPIPVLQQSVFSNASLEKNTQTNTSTGSDESKKQVNFDCKDEVVKISEADNEVFNDNEKTYQTPSKSCSVQSQMSTSSISSSSGLSLLSPTSESSRFECVKAKLYSSIDKRGFDAICLFGANDDDVSDLVNRLPQRVLSRLKVGRLNNSSISNKGLESFMAAMPYISELELSGCNELTNNINLTSMKRLTKLIITDCINIADGFAPKLSHIFGQLTEFTLQAYHITDAFLDYLRSNVSGEKLSILELPNCKEISNQSLRTIARFFPNLKVLSLSGSSKISDEGIEIMAEQMRFLTKLDISWCTRITDAALECMACDLSESLTDLVLDRCIHITDVGLGHIATMSRLQTLEVRWCPQVSDQGLETIITMRTLKNLSIAGCHQITMRSLLCLVKSHLIELELTNCPSVSLDLVSYLRKSLPSCKIIF